MITDYKAAKNDVLQCYDAFLEIARQMNLSEEDRSLTALAIQAKKIREDRFCLIVAGESNSGKSTFINAYLGKEILPVSPLECTCFLTEIGYGKEFVLRATFADGREQIVKGEQDIIDFLKRNTALDEEYRVIPVTTINYEVIVKYKNEVIPEGRIRDFLKAVEADNQYKLPQDEYEKKIREYIKEKQPQWMDVVVKIDLKFPYRDESMKGVRIIDSPGVSNTRGVGSITESYIKSADAIMFLKPITGAGIGSKGFKDFLESSSADKNKKALFLLLTHVAGVAPKTIDQVVNECVKMFGTSANGAGYGLAREQIVPVDSKAQCYYHSFEKLSKEEIKTRIQELVAEGEADLFLRSAWMEAEGDKAGFLSTLKEYSRFDAIDQALNLFGKKAQFLALQEFLERLQRVYAKNEANLKQNVKLYEAKAESPAKLAAKIEEIKDALKEIEQKSEVEVNKISARYIGVGGEIDKRAEEVMGEYLAQVEQISGTGEASLDELEKLTLQQVDKFIEYESELQKKIVMDCRESIGALSDKNAIEFVTLEPDLSEEVINEIKETMWGKATTDEKPFAKKVGGCPGKAKRKAQQMAEQVVKKFNPEKYYQLVKDAILGTVENVKNDAVEELQEFVEETLKAYQKELGENAENKKAELDRVMDEKKTADEIKTILDGLNGLLEKVGPQKAEVDKLLGSVEQMC